MLHFFREGAVPVGGSPMPYVTFGQGPRALVILPGLSLRPLEGAGLMLAWMYRRFSTAWTVTIFDKKARLPEPCTVQALAEDVAEAMARLGLREADVLGISQGGMVAQELALHHPELVHALALGVTACRPNPTLEEAVTCWTALIERRAYREMTADMLNRLYSPGYIKTWGWLFPLALRFTRLEAPERFRTLALACLTCDTWARLPELRCPALVLGGAEDRVVTGEASRELAERLGCALILYPQYGHAVYEEAADFNERLFTFFRDAERS